MKNQKTTRHDKRPWAVAALTLTCIGGWYYYQASSPRASTETFTGSKGVSRMIASQERRNAGKPDSEAIALWQSPTTPQAQWSEPGKPISNPDETDTKHRRATFDAQSMTPFESMKQGDSVVIPLLDGYLVEGRINLIQQDQGWVRVGGEIKGANTGSFFMSSDGERIEAKILLNNKDLAYDVSGTMKDKVEMEEMALADAICHPIPEYIGPEQAPAGTGGGGALQAPPLLSSRPGATAVAYLDFDGEVVTDPQWNNGQTINAAPTPFSNAQITEVWNRVKEDYAPFNIDITTDVSRYNNAPVGSRMRCIITPTNTAAPGAGGVAYLHSFDRSGTTFSSTIPCWVFNQGVMSAAEAASHEIGHTLGLNHDGRTSPSEGYYAGHGSGAVGWAPIMGVGYYQALTQWSKGEYLNANNKEDDVAIIANAANGFGFFTDEAGNTRATAANLTVSNGNVNQTGVISQASDIDFYVVNAGGGSITLNANPNAIAPNVDILLELQDANGNVLASSNPDLAINASITQNVAAGVYYVKIQGTGRGSVTGNGYSNYGSIGQYTITGTVPAGQQQAPVITSASSASGVVGQPFTYQIVATHSPTSYGAVGLPAGLSIDTATGAITGTPTTAGTSSVAISATNGVGTGNATLALTVTSIVNDTFSNNASITLNDGVAGTYPSTINVSGLSGTVSKVTVQLKNLSHTYPDDLDAVLVGPGGQKIMLMSDAGGGGDLNNVTLTLSDSATSALPDSAQIASGTYKPTNYGASDSLPSPAPAGPYGSLLAAFNETNPNGAWRLYVYDDAWFDTGTLAGGWSLTITTAP